MASGRIQFRFRRLRSIRVSVAFSALALASPLRAAEIVDPGQGAVDIPAEAGGELGLSGIAHVGGDLFYAVGDRRGGLFSLEIRVDRHSGFVTHVTLERRARLAEVRDSEGIAVGSAESVLVVDENGPALREHRIADGSVMRRIELPDVYSRARINKSLESLARDPSGALWSVNEEALQGDGPESTEGAGSQVRLLKLGPDYSTPSGQWAYRTDPIPGRAAAGFERSGVVDLAALPDGRLLALERGLGSQGLRSRIYEIDFAGATQIANSSELESADMAPVSKRLLWQGVAIGDNFEGIALGVELDAGDWSLLLISDDGGVTRPRLYPLRLQLAASGSRAAKRDRGLMRWLPPTLALSVACVCLTAWSAKRQRSRFRGGS